MPDPIAPAEPGRCPRRPLPRPTAATSPWCASWPRRAGSSSTEIGKRIVGQHEVIEHLLIALFARGHGLFVGVPGLAKTLLIRTLAETLDLSFGRIQFTPDLMPSDITGTDVLEEDRTSGRRVFRFVRGPIFANVLLADEINRTPPKTQAALLQSMQEYRVTAGGNTYELPLPFLVFATQNPIEQEGTYPLPEAQLDRFMFQIDVGYPSADEEVRIAAQTTRRPRPSPCARSSARRASSSCRTWCCACRSPSTCSRTPWPSAAPRGRARGEPARCASTWPGAPARAPRSTSCWRPRRAPCSTAATPWPSRTSAAGRAGARPPRRPQLPRRGRRRARAAISSPPSSHPSRARRPPCQPRRRPPRTDRHLGLLAPVDLAKLASLALRARTIVEGALAGAHRNLHPGTSLEFTEHKEYAPGDDVRRIDWKAVARTDRYTIKRFEDETEMRMLLVLDTSASMGYRRTSVSKLDYATYLAAALAYLVGQQRDAAGLLAFDDETARAACRRRRGRDRSARC